MDLLCVVKRVKGTFIYIFDRLVLGMSQSGVK